MDMNEFVNNMELLFPTATFSFRGKKLKVHAGSTIDDLPVFNVNKIGQDNDIYDFGINKKFLTELEIRGYYAEISESGDLFCMPVKR